MSLHRLSAMQTLQRKPPTLSSLPTLIPLCQETIKTKSTMIAVLRRCLKLISTRIMQSLDFREHPAPFSRLKILRLVLRVSSGLSKEPALKVLMTCQHSTIMQPSKKTPYSIGPNREVEAGLYMPFSHLYMQALIHGAIERSTDIGSRLRKLRRVCTLVSFRMRWKTLCKMDADGVRHWVRKHRHQFHQLRLASKVSGK